jgi:mannosyltransferase OCH1-like enzyme
MSSHEEIQSPPSQDDIQKEIPKIIYICHKNVKCLSMTYKFWKQLNPGYEIKLFNDAMCEQFLLDKFSQLHQTVFKFIPDGPIKSDFWRVCILYKYGGIYVDADIHPLVPLDKYLMRSCDFVSCITKSNGNFNPHFIAARKNDDVLKKCIDEYIQFYTHRKQSYSYWDWSIVNMFNTFLPGVKSHYNKMSQLQVFSLEQKKYQLFFETTKHDTSSSSSSSDNNKYMIDNIMTKLRPHGLHDYYCTFLNKRIFNTRYINYDPDEHAFKNHVVKNRKQKHNVVGFRFNVNLTKLNNMKQMKNFLK